MTWAHENPVSIRNSIRGARESARSIREVLSLDIWQATNELYLWFASEEASQQYMQDRDEVYQHMRRSTQLNLGLVRSTMLHDTPMDFLWLGVLLERVGQTARILDMHHHMLEGAGRAAPDRRHRAVAVAAAQPARASRPSCALHRGRVIAQRGRRRSCSSRPRFPRSLRYCVQSALKVMRDIWADEDSTDAANAIEILAEPRRLAGRARARAAADVDPRAADPRRRRDLARLRRRPAKHLRRAKPPRRRSCKRSSRTRAAGGASNGARARITEHAPLSRLERGQGQLDAHELGRTPETGRKRRAVLTRQQASTRARSRRRRRRARPRGRGRRGHVYSRAGVELGHRREQRPMSRGARCSRRGRSHPDIRKYGATAGIAGDLAR